MRDVIDWLKRGNNALVLMIPGLLILTLLLTLTARDPEPAPVASAADLAAWQVRANGCRHVLEPMLAEGTLVQAAVNRVEIDDRLWDEMFAADKRTLAELVACQAFGGRPLDQLASNEIAVVYGRRSGKRLAMAADYGITLE